MFRIFLSQNSTSLYKSLPFLPSYHLTITRKWLSDLGNLSNNCPCPTPLIPRPPPEASHIRVTVCGANGQVGSITSFLLKQSPWVDVLKLYDLDCTQGTAMDISHIDTKCRVQSYSSCSDMYEAMCDSQIIMICAGVGRAPGMCLNDLFEYNAPVVKQLAEAIIQVNPKALVAILTNPINSFVPMVSEMFKNARCYDSRKIFGITTIDSMRASSIITNDVLKGHEDPAEFLVPVIGGHSPETMVPILSQTSPCVEIPNNAFNYLIHKIRGAAGQVTMIKQIGGPRLSVALGASRFINNLIRGLKNEKDVTEMAYVSSNLIPGVSFFATPIELGPYGVKQCLGVLKLDEELEKPYLNQAIDCLKCDIERGEGYVRKK